MVAIRWLTDELSVKAAWMDPLPLPDAVTVHHDELLTAVQFELEVTANVVDPAVEGTFWFAGKTVSVGVATEATKEPTIPMEAWGVHL